MTLHRLPVLDADDPDADAAALSIVIELSFLHASAIAAAEHWQ